MAEQQIGTALVEVLVVNNVGSGDSCVGGMRALDCSATKIALADLDQGLLVDSVSTASVKAVKYEAVDTQATSQEHEGNKIERATRPSPIDCAHCGAMVCAQALVIDRDTTQVQVPGIRRVVYTQVDSKTTPKLIVAKDKKTDVETQWNRLDDDSWFQAR